ncbi:unnamed protein product [Trichobilharzia szidati]|nr:unnamed protein product [Trichobilharzia szidati]
MFDTFDVFLVSKVLYLNPSVVLKDDEPQLTYSQKADEIIGERIETYRNRIIVLKRCLTKIEEETAQINSLLENIRNMKNNINQTVEKVYGFKSVDDLCFCVNERNRSIKRLCSALTSREISTDSHSVLQRQKTTSKEEKQTK